VSKLFTRFAGWCAWSLGHPLAFVLACAATLAWAVTGPVFDYSDTWQLVINTGTTVATFLMIFVLQHSQNRDSTAIQAKLDELIRSSQASNKLVRAERLTEKEVEKLRSSSPKKGTVRRSTRSVQPTKKPRRPNLSLVRS
jgi:low affinity Fe/Cu permease